ncbi:hypothetical protein PHYBOEH_009052 [Phytophthora boehmeriae]|uniref:Uncharacterized protein n=1 Tax=Phytophthora boehmeriae TaxID=109152 RepID=A0A8T1WZP3_9STRA|nr:hypothetical protein PHYBOEH_009052 [Phytophthora boehmeriae]
MGKGKNAAKNAKPNEDANASMKATGGKSPATSDAAKGTASAVAAAGATPIVQPGGKNAPVKATPAKESTPAKATGGKSPATSDATKGTASAAAAGAATAAAQSGGKKGKNGTDAKAAATGTTPSADTSSGGKNAKKGANAKAAANDNAAANAQATKQDKAATNTNTTKQDKAANNTKANKNTKEPVNDKAATNAKATKNDQGTMNAQAAKNDKAATNAKTPSKNDKGQANSKSGANDKAQANVKAAKNDKPAANTNAPTNYKASELNDVTVANIQRARELRKTDPERYSKFRNFFTASDTEAARQIISQTNAKREQVNKWARACVSAKVMTCIEESQESQQDLLALVAVSAALIKYGEQELARRDGLGEMDYLVGSRFGTSGLKSKTLIALQTGEESAIDVNFVLRLVLGLAPEKRDACQQLRGLLTLGANSRLTLALPGKESKSTSNKNSGKNNNKGNNKTDRASRDRLLQIAKQAQSDRFQEAMQQVGGQQLYDAIRTLVKEADASAWDTAKDKPALQGKNPGKSNDNVKNAAGAKQKKDKQNKQQQQYVKKADQPKKNLPVEIEKSWAQVPPPAPVNMKNSTPGKSASPVKDKMAAGAGPAGSVQTRPTAIVNSSSSIDTHAATGGKKVGSRGVGAK